MEAILGPNTSFLRLHSVLTAYNINSDNISGKDDARTDSCEMILLREDGEIRFTEPLNRAARNDMVRKDPSIVQTAIASARSVLADKEGIYREAGCTISWKPAFIPYHIHFTVRSSETECQHLASATNRTLRDPVRYHFHRSMPFLTSTGPIREGSVTACDSLFCFTTCKSAIRAFDL